MSAGVLVDELVKVELLAVLGQQLPEEEAVVEILLEVGDASGKLDFVVEPVEQELAHRCYKN